MPQQGTARALFAAGLDLDQLQARVGDMRQLARAEVLDMTDGPGRGARIGRLATAEGFDVEVFVDRALDLGAVSWRGIPLAWVSAAGHVAPGLAGDTSDWQRSFQGGLLTTCGLDQFGSESEDDGEVVPMHGRVHAIPASRVRTWSERVGTEWQVGIEGRIRQSTPFRENLRLDRSVTTGLGSSRLTIHDTVTNDGPVAWPHMVLYHLNLGWPLLSEDTELRMFRTGQSEASRSHGVIPRDTAARAGQEDWMRFGVPEAGFAEQVFRHDLAGGDITTVEVASPKAGVTLRIEFAARQLPHLFQWKMLGQGTYVLGIEPANSSGIAGRAQAREDGSLQYLAPAESRDYNLTFSVLPLDGPHQDKRA
jgi:hypothetical protein